MVKCSSSTCVQVRHDHGTGVCSDFILCIASYAEVLEDRQHKRKVLERKFWRGDDAVLVHEALFSVVIVLAFGKLAYFCQQSSRLGPLQVSMSRMVLHIAYFLAFSLLHCSDSDVCVLRRHEAEDKDGNTRTPAIQK
ncbi:hypothetical protein JTE90_015628 [Oedothorax gibbosus]|uniref:Uncharacterized protein n=1 Tax=Oedothorax gibbosus TaxID=931172 RepID=A0AAV6TP64_9ARAC|nr:hypothetical protein JTE90_015628 [Oedothorax gibbosus]